MRRALAAASVWLLLSATAAAQGSAAPFLWEIRAGDHQHYLLGSVHLLPEAAHPLPAALEQAYTQAETLVFESDLGALDAAETQKAMLAAARSRKLRAEVGAPLAERVQALARDKGAPPELCEPYAAWYCALALQLLSFHAQGFDAAFGLDQHFYRRALADNKGVAWFEAPAAHLQLFTAMDSATGSELLRATLDEFEHPEDQPAALFKAWQSGDEAFVEQLDADARRDYPKLHDSLLVARNRAWLPLLEERLRRAPVQLVIVGAAHLYGPDGLLAALRARGYALRRIADAVTPPPATPADTEAPAPAS